LVATLAQVLEVTAIAVTGAPAGLAVVGVVVPGSDGGTCGSAVPEGRGAEVTFEGAAGSHLVSLRGVRAQEARKTKSTNGNIVFIFSWLVSAARWSPEIFWSM
jgi:hypothetical protein